MLSRDSCLETLSGKSQPPQHYDILEPTIKTHRQQPDFQPNRQRNTTAPIFSTGDSLTSKETAIMSNLQRDDCDERERNSSSNCRSAGSNGARRNKHMQRQGSSRLSKSHSTRSRSRNNLKSFLATDAKESGGQQNCEVQSTHENLSYGRSPGKSKPLSSRVAPNSDVPRTSRSITAAFNSGTGPFERKSLTKSSSRKPTRSKSSRQFATGDAGAEIHDLSQHRPKSMSKSHSMRVKRTNSTRRRSINDALHENATKSPGLSKVGNISPRRRRVRDNVDSNTARPVGCKSPTSRSRRNSNEANSKMERKRSESFRQQNNSNSRIESIATSRSKSFRHSNGHRDASPLNGSLCPIIDGPSITKSSINKQRNKSNKLCRTLSSRTSRSKSSKDLSSFFDKNAVEVENQDVEVRSAFTSTTAVRKSSSKTKTNTSSSKSVAPQSTSRRASDRDRTVRKSSIQKSSSLCDLVAIDDDHPNNHARSTSKNNSNTSCKAASKRDRTARKRFMTKSSSMGNISIEDDVLSDNDHHDDRRHNGSASNKVSKLFDKSKSEGVLGRKSERSLSSSRRESSQRSSRTRNLRSKSERNLSASRHKRDSDLSLSLSNLNQSRSKAARNLSGNTNAKSERNLSSSQRKVRSHGDKDSIKIKNDINKQMIDIDSKTIRTPCKISSLGNIKKKMYNEETEATENTIKGQSGEKMLEEDSTETSDNSAKRDVASVDSNSSKIKQEKYEQVQEISEGKLELGNFFNMYGLTKEEDPHGDDAKSDISDHSDLKSLASLLAMANTNVDTDKDDVGKNYMSEEKTVKLGESDSSINGINGSSSSQKQSRHEKYSELLTPKCKKASARDLFEKVSKTPLSITSTKRIFMAQQRLHSDLFSPSNDDAADNDNEIDECIEHIDNGNNLLPPREIPKQDSVRLLPALPLASMTQQEGTKDNDNSNNNYNVENKTEDYTKYKINTQKRTEKMRNKDKSTEGTPAAQNGNNDMDDPDAEKSEDSFDTKEVEKRKMKENIDSSKRNKDEQDQGVFTSSIDAINPLNKSNDKKSEKKKKKKKKEKKQIRPHKCDSGVITTKDDVEGGNSNCMPRMSRKKKNKDKKKRSKKRSHSEAPQKRYGEIEVKFQPQQRSVSAGRATIVDDSQRSETADMDDFFANIESMRHSQF